MHKIQLISRFFIWVFRALAIIIPLMFIGGWLQAPDPVQFISAETGIVFNAIPADLAAKIMHPLSPFTKFLGAVISLIPLAVKLFILYYLIRLFNLYRRGDIFTAPNVRLIKAIGFTLLIGQLVNPIYEALLSACLTWHNPPGHRITTITFSGANLSILLTALGILLIAWIMAEGCKLQDESRLTI